MDYVAQQKDLIQKMRNKFSRGEASTIVEMQKDYENDEAICLTSIAFIQPEIAEIVEKKIIEPLRRLEPDYFYYPSDSLHITIKNIRTVHRPPLFTEKDMIKVNQLFNYTVPKFLRFTTSFEDLVLLPTSIFAAAYCDESHRDLIQTLDRGLREIGVPDNKRYASDSIFFSNTTVCRFTREPGEEFKNKAKELENVKIGKMIVSEIKLVTCNAVCDSGTRKIIGSYRLKGKGGLRESLLTIDKRVNIS